MRASYSTLVLLVALLASAMAGIPELASVTANRQRHGAHPDVMVFGPQLGGSMQLCRRLLSCSATRGPEHPTCSGLTQREPSQNDRRRPLDSEPDGDAARLSRDPAVSTDACSSTKSSHRLFLLSNATREEPSDGHPAGPSKFIYVAPDPAELLWASFNCHVRALDSLVDDPEAEGTPRRLLPYRSPELFHQLLWSQGKLAGGWNLTTEYFMRLYEVEELEQFLSDAGSSNFVLLDSQALSDHALPATLRELSHFVGLRSDSLLNDSGSRGLQPRGQCSTVPSTRGGGRYAASNFRPMRRASRAFVYRRARPMCLRLMALGLRLEACLKG